MAAVQGPVRFDKIAEKWHGLARRRVAQIRDLERSGRWTLVLHQGATRVVSERSGARRRALVCSGKSAIYIGQAGFAPSGLIRSGALAITIAATIFGQTADAQDLKRGEALLARNCASCHAVGRTGDSPQKLAPTFRSLGQRYPIESLEEALGEGIMSGHPDMPEFSFDAADVGAIIAYLKSIQQR